MQNSTDLAQVKTYDPKYRLFFKTLNLEWIQKYFKVEQKDIEQVEHPEKCLETGGQIFFVLVGDLVAGTCALYKTSDSGFELAKMAVSPLFQGQGLGDLLMKAAEVWAFENGATEVFMLSNTILKPAIELYKKHGYIVIHKGPHPDYERCNIELKKVLKK